MQKKEIVWVFKMIMGTIAYGMDQCEKGFNPAKVTFFTLAQIQVD
jgi:hypothetical protein